MVMVMVVVMVMVTGHGSAGIVLPHPDKTETGGEDAFFVSSHGRGAFGVADGVGGWNLEGVDPSRYSRSASYQSSSCFFPSHRSQHQPLTCSTCHLRVLVKPFLHGRWSG